MGYFPDGWDQSDAVTQHDDDHDVDADSGDQHLPLTNHFLEYIKYVFDKIRLLNILKLCLLTRSFLTKESSVEEITSRCNLTLLKFMFSKFSSRF